MSGEQYNADYFLRGKQTGKSLYEDYRWMPELTIPMVKRMIEYLGIQKHDTILDFGCARGYTVKAFYELGYSPYGYDISMWALENADTDIIRRLTCSEKVAFGELNYSWIIAKDVLEHIEYIERTIHLLMKHTNNLFVVVPLSKFDNQPYVVPDYEKDITHCQRMTLSSWAAMFLHPGWRVEMTYRVPGIKDNYKGWEKGNGFITARRIK